MGGWRERNNRSFEDLESTLEAILSSFYLTLYFWTTAYVHPLSFTFAEFLARFSLSNYVFPCILSVCQWAPYVFLIRLASYL
jgi:hypothetical protein